MRQGPMLGGERAAHELRRRVSNRCPSRSTSRVACGAQVGSSNELTAMRLPRCRFWNPPPAHPAETQLRRVQVVHERRSNRLGRPFRRRSPVFLLHVFAGALCVESLGTLPSYGAFRIAASEIFDGEPMRVGGLFHYGVPQQSIAP